LHEKTSFVTSRFGWLGTRHGEGKEKVCALTVSEEDLLWVKKLRGGV
jgi:hypothetical protein